MPFGGRTRIISERVKHFRNGCEISYCKVCGLRCQGIYLQNHLRSHSQVKIRAANKRQWDYIFR